jgi:hypothetical protein
LGVRTARVVISVVFKPAFGSVTAKHTRSLPLTTAGKIRFFCSSVPNNTTG